MAQLTPDELKEIRIRTGSIPGQGLGFNVRLSSGNIIKADVNPGQAATINLIGLGKSPTSGDVLGRGTPQGAQIAQGFQGQNVVDETQFRGIAPTIPKQEATIISSDQGLDTTIRNQTELGSIEEAIKQAQEKARQIQESVSTLQQAKDKGLEITGQTTVEQAQGFLTGASTSPATGGQIQNINQGIQEGLSDPDKLLALQQKEADEKAALAEARAASDAGDPLGLDAALTRAREIGNQLRQDYTDFIKSQNELRAERTRLAVPGAREQEISRQLKDLRIEADRFRLQTQQDKLAEFEGQTLGFARGRAAELDFKASFIRQEQALDERNLLLELGLAQQARQFEGLAVEQQLEDFASDFELRQQIEEKIQGLEQDVIDKAGALKEESQTILSDFMDDLEGFAFEDLSPESQKRVEELAKSAGIPLELVSSALKAGKARQTFEQGLKIVEAERKQSELEIKKRELEIKEVDLELRGLKFIEGLKEPDFTLGKDQVRFDDEGNVIARGKSSADDIDDQDRSTALERLSLANSILDDPNLDIIIGKSRIFDPRARLAGTRLVKNQIAQLKAMLSLSNRRLLKGQGTISDFEAGILKEAATALDVSLTDADFKKEMKKIRGVFQNAAGMASTVKITDPKTGNSQIVVADREGIEAALFDGLRIEYQ